MKATALFALWLLISPVALAATPNRPEELRGSAWQAFRARAGTDWQAVWNRDTHTPRVLRGSQPIPIGLGRTADQRATAAREFLRAQGDLVGLRPADDDVVVVAETRYGQMHFVK